MKADKARRIACRGREAITHAPEAITVSLRAARTEPRSALGVPPYIDLLHVV